LPVCYYCPLFCLRCIHYKYRWSIHISFYPEHTSNRGSSMMACIFYSALGICICSNLSAALDLSASTISNLSLPCIQTDSLYDYSNNHNEKGLHHLFSLLLLFPVIVFWIFPPGTYSAVSPPS